MTMCLNEQMCPTWSGMCPGQQIDCLWLQACLPAASFDILVVANNRRHTSSLLVTQLGATYSPSACENGTLKVSCARCLSGMHSSPQPRKFGPPASPP